MNTKDDFNNLQTVTVHRPVPNRGHHPTHPICGGDISFIQDDLRYFLEEIAYESPFIGALSIDFKNNANKSCSLRRIVRLDLEKNYNGEDETDTLARKNLIRERDKLRLAINDSFDLIAIIEASHYLDWLNVSPTELLYVVPDVLSHACRVIHLGDVGELFITLLSAENREVNDKILNYVKSRLLGSGNYVRYQKFNE